MNPIWEHYVRHILNVATECDGLISVNMENIHTFVVRPSRKRGRVCIFLCDSIDLLGNWMDHIIKRTDFHIS